MNAVSVFDHVITSIREGRFNHQEVEEILRELWAAYPEVFEQVGLEGSMQPDWLDPADSQQDGDATNNRPY